MWQFVQSHPWAVAIGVLVIFVTQWDRISPLLTKLRGGKTTPALDGLQDRLEKLLQEILKLKTAEAVKEDSGAVHTDAAATAQSAADDKFLAAVNNWLALRRGVHADYLDDLDALFKTFPEKYLTPNAK